MRKVLLLEHVSLDGYVAGPNGEMDWIRLPDEIWSFGDALTARSDTAIYGRVTYGMMAAYWPAAAEGPGADRHAIDHATWVNKAKRYVFSNTLAEAPWGQSSCEVVRGDAVEGVARLKQQDGGDIFLVGSITLAQSLMRAGLVDEYHLNLSPVVLGGGRRLFPEGLEQALSLRLVASQALSQGVLALHYEPA
jgi:dihydrofolate reductase